MKITQAVLARAEAALTAAGYRVRYEKGAFKGGYCLLEQQGLIVVNKFFPLEGRAATLAEATRTLPGLAERLPDADARKLFAALWAQFAPAPEPAAESPAPQALFH